MALAAAKLVIVILLCRHLNISPFSNDMICLVNIDKTTRIRRRCKYTEDCDWIANLVAYLAAKVLFHSIQLPFQI